MDKEGKVNLKEGKEEKKGKNNEKEGKLMGKGRNKWNMREK